MKILATSMLLSLLPLVVVGISGKRPLQTQNNGLHNFECPSTPNCVSSLAADPARRVGPFPLRGTPEQSMERLAGIVRSLPRVTVVSASGEALRAEVRSLLGFVDDLQFALSPDRTVIHVRSAARSGTWDLGVNRRRVERIRKMYLVPGP